MKYILVTDVGSTTTKARFFSNDSGEWRFIIAGETPTTVEAPYEDVTLGVQNAIREIEELAGKKILLLDGKGIALPFDGNSGVDLYCTTSSAGGGLQMMVTGVVKNMTAESANRTALGAGAIVMDILSVEDEREQYEIIKRIRELRPDMILISGGTDGGTVEHVLEIAELIKAAEPKARLGITYKLPIVYAGNKAASSKIKEILGAKFALDLVDNIRPVLDIENTEPARRAIHELFMEHVMSHAPGYTKLMKWTDVDIMPTPAAEGIAMQLIAKKNNLNLLGVGLGGATTNIYSIMDGRFVRSVSANLGMSYSICNVMKEVGLSNIKRWLPFQIDDEELGERLANKMIRPTTIPQILEDLMIEQAVAREAIGRGFIHHKSIARHLKGIRKERKMETMFDQVYEDTYIKMLDVKIIVGTGGLLSHAPRRVQSLLCLTDAFQPEGITRMFQDSVFMMPHLGVLSTVNQDAAWNIFDKDCLLRLGTIIAPAERERTRKIGEKVMRVELKMPNDQILTENVNFGDIKRIYLPAGQNIKAIIQPYGGFDIGAGPGVNFETSLMGGEVGIILDGRGRPLQLPLDVDSRIELIIQWLLSLDAYPQDLLKTRSFNRSEFSIHTNFKKERRDVGVTEKAYAYTPGLKVKQLMTVIKERKLSLPGKVLVNQGEKVDNNKIIAKSFISGDPYMIAVSTKLGIEPEELLKYMTKKEGDYVNKGEIIAQLKAIFGLINKNVASPTFGIIESVSEISGQVVVREPPKPVDINAYITGKVIKIIENEGAVIETHAAVIQGIFGIGGETSGILKIIAKSPDQEITIDDISQNDKGNIIICCSLITIEALRKAADIGVSGIVTGGIRFLDLVEFIGKDIGVAITGHEEVGLTLIVTEGFGKMEMSQRTFNLFKRFQGYAASMNGSTQIRAGVQRPEVIISYFEKELEDIPEENLDVGIIPGTTVRIIRQPYFGVIGKVFSLPLELQKLDTESKVRVLDVELDDGNVVTVPRANVEIIEL